MSSLGQAGTTSYWWQGHAHLLGELKSGDFGEVQGLGREIERVRGIEN